MSDTLDLVERLQALSTQVLPDEVRSSHLERLCEELETEPEEPPSDRWEAQRRLVVSAAGLVVLIGSAALLVMASAAMPGDRLYGTKLTMEQVIGTFDRDVAASNRVDELEALIDRRAEPAEIRAAQSRLASSLVPFADDHALRQRHHQLVLGSGPSGVPVEVAIGWERGDTFASSLSDGELVFVDRMVAADGSITDELTVTGEWTAAERSGGWDLARPTDAGDGATLRIVADRDGVTIVTGAPDGPAGSQQQAAPAPPERQSTFTTDTPSASSGASTTETSAPATSDPPQTTPPPQTAATSSTSASSSTTTTTTTATTATTTVSTTSASTTTRPTTTRPTTTTTRRTTTTRPTTTTTRPTTTTTSQPTTTTTAPTTTTTDDDDDDDGGGDDDD